MLRVLWLRCKASLRPSDNQPFDCTTSLCMVLSCACFDPRHFLYSNGGGPKFEPITFPTTRGYAWYVTVAGYMDNIYTIHLTLHFSITFSLFLAQCLPEMVDLQSKKHCKIMNLQNRKLYGVCVWIVLSKCLTVYMLLWPDLHRLKGVFKFSLKISLMKGV